ncbi:MAG TPA: tetratricopeptide repeat protein [Thermohalobaculum sp.]|nr:tetratricopeptide repeat protein [Thermohalobaculum sp.]
MTENAQTETDEPVAAETAPAEAETEAAEPESPASRIDAARIGEIMASVRSVIVDLVLLALIFGAITIVVTELRRDSVVIDPIRLPESLIAMGYSEDVAALRLWDAVVEINASTPTAKERVTLLPASQRMDFEAADSGVTLQTLVRILRPLLGIDEVRIVGEFICTTVDCAQEGLALRLRVFRNDGMKLISMPPVGGKGGEQEIAEYFHQAALELLRVLDPYVVAFNLYQTDKAAAEREAQRLIRPSQPQRKWAMNLLGFIAADRNDFDAAIGWYQRAVAADPDGEFAIAYTNWGNALRAKGDLDGAIEMQKRAIEIDPKYANAYINWANVLADKGDLDGALAKVSQAAEIDPASAFAFNVWGNMHYSKGELDLAIEKYRRATELDPFSGLAHFNWGIALADMGDLDGAIDQYIRAVEIDPKDAGALANWGIALRDKGDLDGATGKFAEAVEADPRNAFALNNWGIILGKQGDIDDALEKFTSATRIDPAYSNAQFNLGLVLRMLNRTGDAADAFQRYLELDPYADNAGQVRELIGQLREQASGG